MNTKLINKYRDQVEVVNTLWGDDYIPDYRPVAGKSAAYSGQLFEDMTFDVLKSNKNILGITKKPKFKCHYGISREGDYEVLYKDLYDKELVVHIECKQLGDCESHFDKVSHVLYNLENDCYGKNFWLVYDYNRSGSLTTLNKIRCLEERCAQVKAKVAAAGIVFEYLTLDRLEKI